MKPVGKCNGCGQRRLLNHLELCKRCNRESDKYVSQEDLDRLRREKEFVRQAKLKQKEKAAAKAAEEEKKEEAAAKKEEKEAEKKDEKKK